MTDPIIYYDRSGIRYRRWSPPSARAVFILVHGLGAHTGRWEFFADFLSNNSLASYAIELKGFGQSGGIKGYVRSLDLYHEDISRLRDVAAREHPGKRVFLVGESMGGLIAYLSAAAKPSLCDGLICISPAFGSKLSFGWMDYAAIFYSFFFDPMRTFRMPFDSRMCTRDTEYQKAMDESPEETRMITGRMLGNIAFAQIYALLRKQKIAAPVLFLIAGNDAIVDPAASERIFKNINAADKTIISYPGMYHALSIDLGREKVFADMLDWAKKYI